MLVRDLYDYLATQDENLEVTIMDMCVSNEIVLRDQILVLSTDFENVSEGTSVEPYILRAHDFRNYLDGHPEAFDYEVYCERYPVSMEETKETVLELDVNTTDEVNLVAPEELNVQEKKKGFFARLFSK